jgi:integrase
MVNVPLETVELLDLDGPKHEPPSAPVRVGWWVTVNYYQQAFQPALRALARTDDHGNVIEDRLNGKRPSPYTLRHTGINWRLLGGVPMFVVSREARHDSYDTTGNPAAISGGGSW